MHCVYRCLCVCVWYHLCSAHVCNVRYRCSLSGNDSMLLAALLQLSSYTHGSITATSLIYTWQHYCNCPHITHGCTTGTVLILHMAALLQLSSYIHGCITATVTHIHMAALLQMSYTHGSIIASAFTYSLSSLSSISMAGSAGWVGSPTPRSSFMHVHVLTAAT